MKEEIIVHGSFFGFAIVLIMLFLFMFRPKSDNISPMMLLIEHRRAPHRPLPPLLHMFRDFSFPSLLGSENVNVDVTVDRTGIRLRVPCPFKRLR